MTNNTEPSTMTQDSSPSTTDGDTGSTGENVTETNTEGTTDIPVSFVDNFDLDGLLAADFSDDEIMSVTHKGLDYQEVLRHIPENGRKLISNLRAMTTRKTQELAQLKKELEEERALLQQQYSDTLNNPAYDKTVAIANGNEEYDLYDPAGMKAEIERQAAKQLQALMEPAREKLMFEQRQLQLKNFKMQNPELMSDDYRLPVAKMLIERPELKLEDAFYIVKAKVASEQLVKEKARIAEQTNERRAALRQTSTGTNASPTGTPQFRDAWEAYSYHKAQQAKIK